jgi:hypothetical protein
VLQLPLTTVVVLFAARYKAVESEAASMLLLSTLALAVTVPDHPLVEQMIHGEKADWLLPTVLSTTAGAIDVIEAIVDFAKVHLFH